MKKFLLLMPLPLLFLSGCGIRITTELEFPEFKEALLAPEDESIEK
ncbi:MAG: hypothetical protein GWP42_04420 [Verrucomicrobiales bacterium]|nr:hypothetical protein [Verrucomicrobiales bacterium]NCG26768.1 hypothetical protein [Verrucomicrobiales bacterium]